MIVSQPDRILLRRQVERLSARLTGTLLDVGGGDGKRYDDAAKGVTKRIRLEIDAKFKPDIIGSAEAIPLEAASVDSVLCTQVLEHVPHPWKALAEMHRVLKPGGMALITAPQMNELHEEPHDYFRYTPFGLRSLCEDAGFRVVEMDQRGGYFSTLAQMRIRLMIDALRPYQRPWAMWIVGPISKVYARAALWCDAHCASPATTKHAIGWAVLLEKPR